MTAGNFTLRSGEDAAYWDNDATIQSGSFLMLFCYGGIEGRSVTVEDGVFEILPVMTAF